MDTVKYKLKLFQASKFRIEIDQPPMPTYKFKYKNKIYIIYYSIRLGRKWYFQIDSDYVTVLYPKMIAAYKNDCEMWYNIENKTINKMILFVNDYNILKAMFEDLYLIVI